VHHNDSVATTELGTDGAITGLMEEPLKAAGQHPLLVLIYTSAIMMILRFWFAGPIVAKLGPLGLLATSAVLAIAGLYLLSTASGLFAVLPVPLSTGLERLSFGRPRLALFLNNAQKEVH
jgi:hypothetical protein